MTTGFFCGLKPLLFGRKASKLEVVKSAPLLKNPKKEAQGFKMVDRPCGSAGSFILMMELWKKVFTFRDVMDLPHCDGCASINELVLATMRDLQRFYPEIIPSSQLSEIRQAPIDKVLVKVSEALKSIGNSWMMKQEWMVKATHDMHINKDKLISEKAVEMALATLDGIIKITKEQLDMMDEDDLSKDSPRRSSGFSKSFAESYSDCNTSYSTSPVTPTSVLPQLMGSSSYEEFASLSFTSPLLQSLRVQAVGKLNPIDIKRLSFHMPPNVGTQVANISYQKTNMEDNTMAERETNNTSLTEKNNLDEELMFEMDASSNSEVSKDPNIEYAKDCAANNGMPENSMAWTSPVTVSEGRELTMVSHTPLSNLEPTASCHLSTSLPMTVDVKALPESTLQTNAIPTQSPAPPPPPSPSFVPHPNGVAPLAPPPPPPPPPPIGSGQPNV